MWENFRWERLEKLALLLRSCLQSASCTGGQGQHAVALVEKGRQLTVLSPLFPYRAL